METEDETARRIWAAPDPTAEELERVKGTYVFAWTRFSVALRDLGQAVAEPFRRRLRI